MIDAVVPLPRTCQDLKPVESDWAYYRECKNCILIGKRFKLEVYTEENKLVNYFCRDCFHFEVAKKMQDIPYSVSESELVKSGFEYE